MTRKFTLKLFILLLAIFTCLFISNKFAGPVQGETDQSQSGQRWRCLKSEQVGGKTKRPPSEVDLNITGKGYPSNKDIYVVLCVPPKTKKNEKPKNYRCTTGNTDFDRTLFSADRSGSIAPLTFEVPKGANPNQTVQAAGGNVSFVSHMSNSEGHVSYAFFGVTLNETNLTGEGQGSTLQYGTFEFGQDPAKCLSIRWDPYGRVFDSKSLEPISGVRVRLLDENKLLVILKGLLNPQKTEVDGQFNFSVGIKPGTTRTFYLDPIPLAPLTHTFTATPNLHPNYSKAYSDLYKPDEAIVEAAGIPEHRDIPLDPGGGAPFRSTPEVITIDSVNFGSQTRYEGTISHPLSIVTLVGKNSQEVARATADKNGAWEIVLDNAKIPQDSSLQVNIIKVDITTLASKSKNTNLAAFKNFVTKFLQNVGFLNGQVLAQDTTAEFQPILSYVEGYAYDSSGQVIPNAIVKIKLEMSDSVYYQTNADEKGFFTLLSRNLPILTYYLEFTHPVSGKSTVMSTSEFVQKNQSYLAENNVNLMTASKNGQSVNPTIPVTNTQSQNLAPTVPVASTNSQLNLILTLVVLVVILGVAGGVLLYIKKKETQPTNLP